VPELRHEPPVSFREDIDQEDLLVRGEVARALWFHGGCKDVRRPVLCLAGMGADGRSFVRQRPLSKDQLVLLLNSPRHTPAGEDPLRYAASAVEGFIDRLGLHRPVLVGSSFGGAVATQVALDRPTGIRGLVLVGAVLSRAQIPLASPAFVDLLEAPAPLARLVAPFAAEVMGGFRLDREARDEIVREARNIAGAELKRRLLRLLSLDLLAPAARLGLPMLFVHGTRDYLVPWRRAKAVARKIPGAQFALIPRAGHLPYLSDAAAFNEVVAGFLRKVLA
jgi:pimeloyl-ACP methyl ester carboxylesterase